jgi:large repetitive protein
MFLRIRISHPIIALLMLLTLSACTGAKNNSGTPDPVNDNTLDRLTVKADTNEVVQNGEVNMTAMLKGVGTFDQTVTWKLTGPGKLSATSGLEVKYTAPSVVDQNTDVVVEATPLADPSLAQKLTITLRSNTFVTLYSFADLDFDNFRDADEDPIPNVKFSLKDDFGNVLETATSDVEGKTVFRELLPRVYVIEQTIPVGYGTSADPLTGRLPLTVGAKALKLNFGLTTGEIRGMVYIDIDFDQVRNPSVDQRKNPIRNVQGEPIYLDPGVVTDLELNGTDIQGNKVNRQTKSSPDGRFAFRQLPAGTYTVTELQLEKLADWKDTGKANPDPKYANIEQVSNTPDVIMTHDGPSRKDTTSPISLAVGELKGTLYFAESDLIITGYVFVDKNRNGYDRSYNGVLIDDEQIPNVTVKLRGQVTNTFPGYGIDFVAEAITDAKGKYFFEGVPYGSYAVEETDPLGYGIGHARTVASPNYYDPIAGNADLIPVCRGLGCPAAPPYPVSFGDTLSTLSGFVFLDDDNDGIKDTVTATKPAEPGLIFNVPVVLTGKDINGKLVTRNARIGQQGEYTFDQLLAGEYKLEIPELTPGYVQGKASAGLIGANTVGIVTATAITNIVIPVNIDGINYNFGYQKK